MKRSKSAKRSRKAAKKKRTKPDDTEVATTFIPAEVTKAVESPAPAAAEPKTVAFPTDQSKPKPLVSSSRSEAARRTAEGKFTKAVFAEIGGTECPRFTAMTWKEAMRLWRSPKTPSCGIF
jgi:hypothetical protein